MRRARRGKGGSPRRKKNGNTEIRTMKSGKSRKTAKTRTFFKMRRVSFLRSKKTQKDLKKKGETMLTKSRSSIKIHKRSNETPLRGGDKSAGILKTIQDQTSGGIRMKNDSQFERVRDYRSAGRHGGVKAERNPRD